MGSHNFSTIVMDIKSAEDAYRYAVADALHEHGHDGYNGSISTTDGVREVPGVQPMTLAEAEKIGDERLDGLNKWDVCEALPLVDETAATYRRLPPVDVTLTVPGATYDDRAAMRAAIAKAAKVKAAAVDSWRPSGHSWGDRSDVMVLKATAPTGTPTKKFFILDVGNRRMPEWSEGFESQAAARAALNDCRDRRGFGGGGVPRQLEIIAITRRDQGEPLVSATVSTKTVTITLTVQLHELVTSAKRGKTLAGWYFYGWAAC